MAPDRTPEERERARLERAAKRAKREGKPPPADLPSTELPPDVAPEPEQEQPFEPIQPPPASESERQPTEELEAPPLPEPDPEPLPEPEPLPAPEPEPEPEPLPEPEPEPLPEPIDDVPETMLEPAPLPDPQPVTATGPPPAVPVIEPRSRADAAREILDRHKAQKQPRRRTGRRRVGIGITLGALALMVLVVGWFAFSLFQPFKGDGDGRVAVQIPTGASVGQIADLLEQEGVISSAFFFEARATVAGRRDDFKAGQFQLRRDMSSSAAMDAISKGPPANVTQIVIPEGRARTQVKDIIGKRLPGNYLTASRRSSALDPRRYGAPRTVSSLEGFLFPDTYELKKGSTATTLVNEQLAQFKRRFASVDLAGSKRRKLTAFDVLTIASMIDQEAQVPRERRVIASVIMNRLREGIPLGIDATIRYATNNRTSPLKESEINSPSPYNTRARRGLPPGPIGSPGLAAIRAAANPANTKFLYYVVKPNTCGEHAFSETNAEFQRNVDRYNAARARRGGKSPTKC